MDPKVYQLLETSRGLFTNDDLKVDSESDENNLPQNEDLYRADMEDSERSDIPPEIDI